MSSPPSELGVWTVGKLLGEGAFSKVYAATIRHDMLDHSSTANLRSSEWVLKISPVPVKKGKAKPKGKLADALLAARLLHWEYTVYSSFLAKHPYVPTRPFGRAGFGDQDGWRFLAMARMGKTLRQHVDDEGGSLDGAEALSLGIRVLDSLSLLHAKGVLFRDVKPENFMFDADGELCIIDFGAAVKFIMHDGKHLESGGAAGTPLFMSTHSHVGSPPSRRDDLESLCYMVLWMMLGVLPWEDADSEDSLIRCKQDTRVEDLIAGQQLGPAGDAAADALDMVKALGVHEDPDYDAIKRLFASHAATSTSAAAGSSRSGKRKAKAKAKAKPITSRAKAKTSSFEPNGRHVVRVDASDEEVEEKEGGEEEEQEEEEDGDDDDYVEDVSPVPARKRGSARTKTRSAEVVTTKAKRPTKSAPGSSGSSSVSYAPDKPKSLVEIAMSKARAKSNKLAAKTSIAVPSSAPSSSSSSSSSRASVTASARTATAAVSKVKAKKAVASKVVFRVDKQSESKADEEVVAVVSDDDEENEEDKEMMVPLAVRLARRGNKVVAAERNVVSACLSKDEEEHADVVRKVEVVAKRSKGTRRQRTDSALPSDADQQESKKLKTKRRSGPAGRVIKTNGSRSTVAAATAHEKGEENGVDEKMSDEENAASNDANMVGEEEGGEEKKEQPRRSGRVRAQMLVNYALQGMVFGGATMAMMQAYTTGE